MHAIQKDLMSWTENKTQVTVVAKTQLAHNVRGVQPIHIQWIMGFVDDSSEDHIHCPVGTIFHYVYHTKNLRQDKKLLVISYKKRHNKIR